MVDTKPTKEAHVRDPVCKFYEDEVGILHVRNVFRPGPAVGFPDDTFYFYGRCLHVEFKGPRGKLSRNQEDKIATLRDAGHMVIVIDSIEEGKEAIRFMNEGGVPFTAVQLEKIICQRTGTTYRGLVENARKIEAW